MNLLRNGSEFDPRCDYVFAFDVPEPLRKSFSVLNLSESLPHITLSRFGGTGVESLVR